LTDAEKKVKSTDPPLVDVEDKKEIKPLTDAEKKEKEQFLMFTRVLMK
jgi:hypothetical protein